MYDDYWILHENIQRNSFLQSAAFKKKMNEQEIYISHLYIQSIWLWFDNILITVAYDEWRNIYVTFNVEWKCTMLWYFASRLMFDGITIMFCFEI